MSNLSDRHRNEYGWLAVILFSLLVVGAAYWRAVDTGTWAQLVNVFLGGLHGVR
jgi:hypothetical protein